MRIKHTGFSATLLAVILMLPIIAMSATEVQSPAPDFALKSNSGENIRLSELRGEVVLINFWATWCGPCRQEMPILSALHDKYKSMGFIVLGINVEEESAAARKLLKELPVSFPVLFDTDSSVSKQYRVAAMPSTVLIDRNGNMRYLHRGYRSGLEDIYVEQVRELIRE